MARTSQQARATAAAHRPRSGTSEGESESRLGNPTNYPAMGGEEDQAPDTNQATTTDRLEEPEQSPEASCVTARETGSASRGSQVEGDSVNQTVDQEQASRALEPGNNAKSNRRQKKKNPILCGKQQRQLTIYMGAWSYTYTLTQQRREGPRIWRSGRMHTARISLECLPTTAFDLGWLHLELGRQRRLRAN